MEAALAAVTLDPGQVLNQYPHQLSGGQLQRLLVARALLLELEILVADEIISMLDASTRIDVLNLLGDLKSRGMGIFFITHDLSLGNYISDRTVILRRGASSRWAQREKVLRQPAAPVYADADLVGAAVRRSGPRSSPSWRRRSPVEAAASSTRPTRWQDEPSPGRPTNRLWLRSRTTTSSAASSSKAKRQAG